MPELPEDHEAEAAPARPRRGRHFAVPAPKGDTPQTAREEQGSEPGNTDGRSSGAAAAGSASSAPAAWQREEDIRRFVAPTSRASQADGETGASAESTVTPAASTVKPATGTGASVASRVPPVLQRAGEAASPTRGVAGADGARRSVAASVQGGAAPSISAAGTASAPRDEGGRSRTRGAAAQAAGAQGQARSASPARAAAVQRTDTSASAAQRATDQGARTVATPMTSASVQAQGQTRGATTLQAGPSRRAGTAAPAAQQAGAQGARNAAASQTRSPAASSARAASAQVVPAVPARRRYPFLVLLLLLAVAAGAGYGGYRYGEQRTMEAHAEWVGYGSLKAQATIAEDQLDEPVGTYVLNDQIVTISAREVLEFTNSLDDLRMDDGSYPAPRAEDALALVRTRLVQAEVERQGIEVGEKELLAYAQEAFGTDDVEVLAANFQMSEATMRERLRESAGMALLRRQVLADAGIAVEEQDEANESVVAEPPADTGKSNMAKRYARYILGLAGDEWDSDAERWVSPDSPYAHALHGFDITNTSATAEAARAAYLVALRLHEEELTAADTTWSAYVNELLRPASIYLGSIAS